MMKLASTCPNSDMVFVWRLLCLHPNTIKHSYYYYYYYYSSSSSPNELIQPNSQRLMIRSLLSFTERWILISKGALRSWNFQNGPRCHGNREHMSKSLFWNEELIGNDDNWIQDHFYDATVSNMAANKIYILSIVSDFNENVYQGIFWSEEFVGNDEICIQDHFYEATIFKMTANKIVKLSMVSDFNENWYLGVFWNEELVGALNSDMGVAWGLLCLHPNTVKPSYYYLVP